MISHLRGRMIEKTPTHVILECNGVGYHLEVSLHTFSGIEFRRGAAFVHPSPNQGG